MQGYIIFQKKWELMKEGKKKPNSLIQRTKNQICGLNKIFYPIIKRDFHW